MLICSISIVFRQYNKMKPIRKNQTIPINQQKHIAKMSTAKAESSDDSPLILIYYNIRGKLQSIRNLIAYLELPHIQLHLQEKNHEKKILSEQIRAVLRDIPIESSQLPLLVHEGFRIYDSYPIMAYICRRFGHEELLGRSIQQRARFIEIMSIYTTKQPSTLAEVFVLADECYGKPQFEVFRIKCAYFQKLMKFSGYAVENCRHLSKQINPSFILGEITLLDFTFLQTGHYILGFFGDLDSVIFKYVQLGVLTFDNLPVSIQNLHCLEVIRNYLKYIKSLPFYQKNKEYLQSKTVISFLFSPQRVAGIRRLWMGCPSMAK